MVVVWLDDLDHINSGANVPSVEELDGLVRLGVYGGSGVVNSSASIVQSLDPYSPLALTLQQRFALRGKVLVSVYGGLVVIVLSSTTFVVQVLVDSVYLRTWSLNELASVWEVQTKVGVSEFVGDDRDVNPLGSTGVV